LISYRALHLANQQKDKDAVAAARKATSARLALAREYRPDLDALLQSPSSWGLGSGTTDPMARVTGSVVASRAGTALGDVVQSKYIEGAMLVREGRLKEADRTLSEATAIYDADTRVPRRWLPQIRLLQADIAERNGDLGTAERLIRATIDQQRALFTGSRAEATAWLALGRVQAAEGKSADALAAYRAGFAILRKTDADFRFAQAWPFVRAALAEAERTPEQSQSLFAEMFEVAQMVRGSITAQTLALATARLSASSQEVAPLIRELQDARRDRDIVNERLTLAQADPDTLPPQMQALDAEWKAVNAKIAGLEQQVQARHFLNKG
jgi:tetratricopeptide (TPR) repeat protein